MRRALPLFFLSAGLGCASGSGSTPNPSPAPVEATPKAAHTRVALDRPDLHGASGLTRGPSGHLYTVLERDHRLFELALGKDTVDVVSSRAVIGAPGGVDLEAIAFVDEKLIAFGTETTKTDRAGDQIVFGELQADKVVITGEPVPLEYAAWGITPERNRGIEGLCAVPGVLVAAVETAGNQDGQRFAPVATFDLATKKWAYYRVGLTSETGKLSALTCREAPEAIEVLAVERHYEVARVVQFSLPRAGTMRDVAATVLLDVAPLVGGDEKIPNFEGIALASDGRIVTISDNDYGGITGPTELLVLPAPTQATSK